MIKPYNTPFQQSWKHEYNWRGHTMLWPSVLFFSCAINLVASVFRVIPPWLTTTYIVGSVVFGVWFLARAVQFVSYLKKSMHNSQHPKAHDWEKGYIPSFMKDTLKTNWKRVLADAFDPYCTMEQQQKERGWLKEHQQEWLDEFHQTYQIQQQKAQQRKSCLPSIPPPPDPSQKKILNACGILVYLLFLGWVSVTLSLHWNVFVSFIGGSIVVAQWVKFQEKIEKKMKQRSEDYVNQVQQTLKESGLSTSDCVLLAFDPSLDDATRKSLVNYLNVAYSGWTADMEHLPLYLMKLSLERGEDPVVPMLDFEDAPCHLNHATSAS